MKRVLVLLSCAILFSGCANFRKPHNTPMPVAVKAAPADVDSDGIPLVDANGAPIERIAFRSGVSSVTVENMAKQVGCVGGRGAGLITEPGPVEVYRMVCEDRKVYMAKCEFRQCKAM